MYLFHNLKFQENNGLCKWTLHDEKIQKLP